MWISLIVVAVVLAVVIARSALLRHRSPKEDYQRNVAGIRRDMRRPRRPQALLDQSEPDG